MEIVVGPSLCLFQAVARKPKLFSRSIHFSLSDQIIQIPDCRGVYLGGFGRAISHIFKVGG